MNKISILDHTGKSKAMCRYISKVTRGALSALRLLNVEVSIALITDVRMKKLNSKYRKIPRATDVLSFSQGSPLPSGRTHLGDIVIATPTARRQARQAGHETKKEFALLTIHGLLHLLGHDHANPKGAKKMFALQKKILGEVYHEPV